MECPVEALFLDCGRPTAQLMRDSLGRPMRTLIRAYSGLLIFLPLSIACPSVGSRSVIRVDTALVYVQGGPQTYNDFPQVRDSSRILPDGSLLPDSTVPTCSPEALPDTLGWPRSASKDRPSAKSRGVSIRLPATFSPVSVPGYWQEQQSGEPRTLPADFRAWIVPRPGYDLPRLGGDVEQVGYSECRLVTAHDVFSVITFEVHWAGATDVATHYVLAISPLAKDSVLHVTASAHDSLTQVQFVSALRTIFVN